MHLEWLDAAAEFEELSVIEAGGITNKYGEVVVTTTVATPENVQDTIL